MTDGKQILVSLESARDFFENVANFLATASEPMARKQWRAFGNTGTAGGSNSILSPRRWIPFHACRFYTNKDHSNIIAMIAVLLGSLEGETELSEPLITAGLLRYNKEVGDNWTYDFARMYLSCDAPMPDGKWLEPPIDKLDSGDKYPIQKAVVFARTLVAITNSSDIESMITSKLLAELDEWTK